MLSVLTDRENQVLILSPNAVRLPVTSDAMAYLVKAMFSPQQYRFLFALFSGLLLQLITAFGRKRTAFIKKG